MSRAVIVLRVLGTVAVATTLACGGPTSQNTDPGGPVSRPEAVVACDTLRSELAALDLEADTEANLRNAMNRAIDMAPRCADLQRRWAPANDHPVLVDARASEVAFHALLIESVVSRRFEAMAGYCQILADLLALLYRQIGDGELALQARDLDDATRRRLEELVELDLQAIDILFLHADAHCRDPILPADSQAPTGTPPAP